MGRAPYATPADSCPACSHPFAMATPVAGRQGGPQPGDYTICICCGEFLAFDADLKVRIATSEELADIETHAPGLIAKVRGAPR